MWSYRLASSINGLAFSSDGRTLYTADNACRVYAWDAVARTRQLVLRHEFISGIVPTGLVCADRFLVFLWTNPLRVWDFTAQAKRIEVPPKFATKAAAQVDAARGRLLVLGTMGRSVLPWDLMRQKAGPAIVRWAKPVRETWSKKFCLSADGRTLAVEEDHGRVIFRKVPSGTEIGRMRPGDRVAYMFLSPDGRSLCCCASYRWRLWDVPAGTVRCDLDSLPLAFHPTAPVCALASPGGVTLLNVQTGEAFRSFDFDLGEVRYACFSPDGLTCVAGGSGKRFAVFDVDLGSGSCG